MILQKSQPVETGHEYLPSASTGPLKKYGCITPRTKSACLRNTRKSWKHLVHVRTAMARTGRYDEKALHKAGVGASRPRV